MLADAIAKRARLETRTELNRENQLIHRLTEQLRRARMRRDSLVSQLDGMHTNYSAVPDRLLVAATPPIVISPSAYVLDAIEMATTPEQFNAAVKRYEQGSN